MLTQAQKDYFTYSQLRDRAGALIPCYHYTLAEFDAFDPARIGGQSGDGGFFGQGFYFTGMPGFNSCCWDESGDKTPIRLECYLDIRKPFIMDKLSDGPDYDADRPWLYDKDTFLRYLKDNSDGEDSNRIVIDPEEDFTAYVRANPYEYEEHDALIRAYEAGELDWYAPDDTGTSMSRLYDRAERERAIVTPYNLDFGNIHRGLLEPYGALVTAYAEENGCDGIVSDTGDQPVEVVAFRPNQIKAVNNLHPTGDNRFVA